MQPDGRVGSGCIASQQHRQQPLQQQHRHTHPVPKSAANFSHISCKKLLLIIFILVRLRANFLLTEALPADTVPPFLKMAGSFAKPSRVVCGLGCSSTSKLSGPDNSNNEKETSINFILNHNRQVNYCILKMKRLKKVTSHVKHLKMNRFSQFIHLHCNYRYLIYSINMKSYSIFLYTYLFCLSL